MFIVENIKKWKQETKNDLYSILFKANYHKLFVVFLAQI